MKKQPIDPANIIIDPIDAVKPADKKGKPVTDDPNFLGTKPLLITRKHNIIPVNMMLPPGITRFYVERLDKTHIRFLIRTSEIQRIAEKAEKIMEASEIKPPSN
jgi:hypothetical protein